MNIVFTNIKDPQTDEVGFNIRVYGLIEIDEFRLMLPDKEMKVSFEEKVLDGYFTKYHILIFKLDYQGKTKLRTMIFKEDDSEDKFNNIYQFFLNGICQLIYEN